MEILEKRLGDVSVFSLAGSLDTRKVPGLQRRLLDALAETPKIVLDLSGLKYISSSGVAVFLMVAKRARNRRGGLRLAGVHGAVKETFSILRLDSKGPVLNIFPTVDEALKDF